MFDSQEVDTNGNPIPSFNDPVHASLNACAFFAGLSSIAWVYWPIIKNILNPTFAHLTDAGVPDRTLKCCTVSKRYDLAEVNSTDAGIWAPVYAKAYVVDSQNDKDGTNCTARSDEYCPLSQFGVQFPQKIYSLLAIAWGAEPIWVGGAANQWDPATVDPYTKINSYCETIQGARRTKYPMVAWTQTATHAVWSGKAGGYDQMRADHCYSVLGVIAPDYIVLRNPRGISEGSTNPDLYQNGATYIPTAVTPPTMYGYQKGNQQNLVKRRITADIKLDMSKGIFALKNTAFKQFFMGFGRIS
jgi:hypothetical protein